MTTRLFMQLFTALISLVFVAAPVFAHHGWRGNEGDAFELTGTVTTTLSLAGPHATMTISVDNQLWEITLAPPARTERAGLKEGIIPVGATVTVSGHRNDDARRFEVKTERVTYNGTLYNVYPDRE